MEDLLERFLEFYQVHKNAKPGTIRIYRAYVGKFLEFADKDVEAVTAEDVNRFIMDIKARGCSINYQRGHQAAIRMFFHWYCGEINTRHVNPMNKVKRIPEEVKVPGVITPAELIAMVNTCDISTFFGRRDAAMLCLLADTGIRRAEAAALKVGNVKPVGTHFVLTVPRVKNSYERSIPFCRMEETSFVSEFWTSYWQEITILKNWGPNHALFLSDGVTRAGFMLGKKGVAYIVERAAKRSGVNATTHTLRHFFGTYSYLNGVDIMTLRQLMGHALIETTSRYIHISNIVSGKVLSKTATANMVAPRHVTGYVKMMKESQLNSTKTKR